MKTGFECEKFGFKICRVCLKGEGIEKFISLLNQNGANAEMIYVFSGVNVLIDEGKHEALICPKCAKKLAKVYEFRRLIRFAEDNYFRLLRESDEANAAQSESDSDSEVEVAENNNDSGKSANKGDHVCHKMSSLIKCWRCSLKNISKILPHAQNKNSTDVPKVVLNSLDSQGCKNLINEPQLCKNVEIPDIQFPQIKVEPVDLEEKNLDQLPLEKPVKRTFQCRICRKTMVTRISLRNHTANTHFNVKRYFCDLCDEKSFYKSSMRRHIFLRHIKNPNNRDEERKFQCSKCEKRFFTPHELKIHFAHAHTDDRPWICWCQKAFKTKGCIKQHQLNVHGLCFKQ